MADAAHIKAEAEASPGRVGTPDEEDLYEDSGDLEFYDKNAPNTENIYLARVPGYVWEAWVKMTEKLGDNDEVQIGTLRNWNEVKPNGVVEPKLRMLLNADLPEHQRLPREYDIDVNSSTVQNHYIFSEEDLPGFKAKNKARAEAIAAGITPAMLRNKEGGGGRPERPSYDRRSRYQPYYRKAIPKRTKLVGKIKFDLRMEPRDKEEENKLVGMQLAEMERPKTGLQIISRNKASALTSNLGTANAAKWSNNFIKSAPATAKPKKGETIKAARIPKDQLLDLIFDCFRQYQYWPMKALRQRTQQPDAYLRQVLEEVAVLNKSGRFANNYSLSDAYKDKSSEAKEAAAEADEDDDDDDDDEEMEDVLPGA